MKGDCQKKRSKCIDIVVRIYNNSQQRSWLQEYNSIINSTSQQLAPSLIQVKVKQRGTKDAKWITRCSKEGNSIWFFGGFLRTWSAQIAIKLLNILITKHIYTFDQYYKMSKMDGAYGNHLRQNNLKGNLFYEAR